jgi:hypothetical protein|tara:strand:- start:41 stop:538 length:498 start_codon:yes stop_codon:yes gene_type:complete
MTTLNNLVENDEYFTPKKVWEDILHYLDSDKIYLDPFYGNSSNINNLKELGLNAIGADLDCFELLRNLEYDIIISNSPFSKEILTEFLYNLDALQRPFILILPITKIFTKYFKTAFRSYKDIQLIIPSSRISFIDPRSSNNKSNPSFVCCYVCYKINLQRDIIFL